MAVTPETARKLRAHGHALRVQTQAGLSAIDTAKASALEAALAKLQATLTKPRGTQDVATIMQRLGRAKQRFARAAQHYEITVATDPDGKRVTAIPLGQTHQARQRGCASGRVLLAHHLGRPGQRHAVAHLHHAH